MLVTSETLAQHLGDPNWIVFDVRHDLADPTRGRKAYAEGHIPGAYFLHLDDELSAPKTGSNGRHPLPDPKRFAERISKTGLAPASRVVVYDDTGGSYAVRLWWMLRWLGHEDVALLDGGWQAWIAAQRPVSRETPPDRAGTFV